MKRVLFVAVTFSGITLSSGRVDAQITCSAGPCQQSPNCVTCSTVWETPGCGPGNCPPDRAECVARYYSSGTACGCSFPNNDPRGLDCQNVGSCTYYPICPPGYTTECVGDQQPNECGCCVNYSPILIDIGGNGLRLSSAEGGALFDINGLGLLRWVAWPEDPDDAFLCLDRNGNGLIDSGSELFGNTTPLASGAIAEHGYQALAELDVDGNDSVDAQDPAFLNLRLWLDVNRNGVSDPDELVSLAAAGITGLSTDYRESARRDRWGNRFRFRAKVTATTPPHVRFSYDVFPVTAPGPTPSLQARRSCAGKGWAYLRNQ